MNHKLKHILIVEDDITFSMILARYLDKNNFSTTAINSIGKLKEISNASSDNFDLILLDYHLPDGNAMNVLEYLRNIGWTTPVLIMTSIIDVKTAVQAIKKGAKDYITKPINQEELLATIHELTSAPKIATADPQIANVSLPESEQYVSGISPLAVKLQEHITLVAPTDMSVLIAGESGTGKEHIARTVHAKSKRSNGPFLAVDCGTLNNDLASSLLFGHIKGAFTGAITDTKGIIEQANGGTLFLDEIGNLSYDNQIKLLRVLQEKELLKVGSAQSIKVDIRIIAATNEDFTQAIQNGSFRADLFHRINEFKLNIPPLRNRIKDLPVFMSHFISISNNALAKGITGMTAEVKNLFENYAWPGNIRELQNVIKRAVLLAKTNEITLAELPEDMLLFQEVSSLDAAVANTVHDLKNSQEHQEKQLIIKTLMETNFNKSKAARLLKIDRTTLYQKLTKYGIVLD